MSAVVSTGIGASEVMGRLLGVVPMPVGMLEFTEGVIEMSFLGRNAILTVVADGSANLENVRYQVKKRLPALEDEL